MNYIQQQQTLTKLIYPSSLLPYRYWLYGYTHIFGERLEPNGIREWGKGIKTMPKEKDPYKEIKKEWDKLLSDFSYGVYYDGDPKRYDGTQEPELWQFIEKHLTNEYNRGKKEGKEEIIDKAIKPIRNY